MKLFKALSDNAKRKDTAPMERFEYSRVKTTLESLCKKYLNSTDDILRFEALPAAIDGVLFCLESKEFKENYDFEQESETIFAIKLKELNLL